MPRSDRYSNLIRMNYLPTKNRTLRRSCLLRHFFGYSHVVFDFMEPFARFDFKRAVPGLRSRMPITGKEMDDQRKALKTFRPLHIVYSNESSRGEKSGFVWSRPARVSSG